MAQRRSGLGFHSAHPPLHRGGDHAGRHALGTKSWLRHTSYIHGARPTPGMLCVTLRPCNGAGTGAARALLAKLCGAMPIGRISENGRNLPCSARKVLGKLAPRDRSRTQSRIPQRVRGGLPASTVTRGAKCRSHDHAPKLSSPTPLPPSIRHPPSRPFSFVSFHFFFFFFFTVNRAIVISPNGNGDALSKETVPRETESETVSSDCGGSRAASLAEAAA